MIVTWLGHSCFLLKSKDGLTVLIDPFQESEVGYVLPHLEADIVIISHDHDDHNNVEAAGEKADVIFGPGEYISMERELLGVKSYHDDKRGRLRGPNTIFCFELDGIRVCHLGDLGHALSKKQIEEIGRVDLLFIPVGGIYTIDAATAGKVMEQLHPRIAVPMHYQTAALSFLLEPVDDFLRGREHSGPQESLHLTGEDLTGKDLSGQGKVVVLSCPTAEKPGGSID